MVIKNGRLVIKKYSLLITFLTINIKHFILAARSIVAKQMSSTWWFRDQLQKNIDWNKWRLSCKFISGMSIINPHLINTLSSFISFEASHSKLNTLLIKSNPRNYINARGKDWRIFESSFNYLRNSIGTKPGHQFLKIKFPRLAIDIISLVVGSSTIDSFNWNWLFKKEMR